MMDPSGCTPNDAIRKMQTREARIGIIGMGYVGLRRRLCGAEERA
jgi:UDP-N-acetyl-D-mannosaminuronate dehydrogenase